MGYKILNRVVFESLERFSIFLFISFQEHDKTIFPYPVEFWYGHVTHSVQWNGNRNHKCHIWTEIFKRSSWFSFSKFSFSYYGDHWLDCRVSHIQGGDRRKQCPLLNLMVMQHEQKTDLMVVCYYTITAQPEKYIWSVAQIRQPIYFSNQILKPGCLFISQATSRQC